MTNGLSRLLALKSECRDVAREMANEGARMRRLEGKEPVRAISSFNLFQTPTPIGEEMAELLGPAGRCLEPSAGLGRLVAVTKADEWVLVEQSVDCCAELRRLGHHVINEDFLTCSLERLGGLFDSVIMNPPFKMGTDVRHINWALQFLKPGGKLVSLCYNGTKQNAKLKPIATTWKVLPENSFKDEGTRASVVLMSIST